MRKSLACLQLEEDRELARGATKDANEQLIGQLLVQGILQLDFGFTAYATNAYLKVSQRGLQGEATKRHLQRMIHSFVSLPETRPALPGLD